jgi:molybdopterin biosynthesis enzyme
MLNSIKKPSGLKCFYKAKLIVNDGIINLDVPSSQASYLVGNFSEVDHWVVLPEEGTQVNEGELVEFCLF